ncbi:MAG: amidophosphoribosyltransferase [Geminicoccaceae bacterium]
MAEPDKFQDECGVFGIFGHDDASALTALGLHALQHRGQEAAGIVSCDGHQFFSHRVRGLVGDNFSESRVIDTLPGGQAVGHVRYATTGATMIRNIQPFFAELAAGGLAIAHNGNITNALHQRSDLVAEGSLFQSTTDTEVIVHLVARSRAEAVVDRLIESLSVIEGAYSLVALSEDALIGARDPLGVRPLVLGSLEGAGILASESCALDILGATYVREIEPGEMVIVDRHGITSLHPFPPMAQRFCVFEYVYFARPDSKVEGRGVYEVRKRIGAELARESPLEIDVVVPVPDSGVPASIGYAQACGKPFEFGIIRNHYVGRTFIQPTDSIRHLGVKLKHSANQAVLADKRVVLIDDSIVRGTTSTKIVAMVRAAGAREVHMRIASPPTTHSCFYGVDTPERHKLLAAQHSVDDMARIIGVDSLAFISLDGLYRATHGKNREAHAPAFCDACFTGDYPTRLADQEAPDFSHRQLNLLEQV